MPHFTDVVFDIETTGLNSETNAIIQIAAVKFNPYTREVDENFFNRCLLIPPDRYWDEGTREWWLKMPDLLRSIFERMEEPQKVMEDFHIWLDGAYCDLAGWNKPLSFDTPFVASYFRKYGMKCPLPHWKGRDVRSFVEGLNFGLPRDIRFDERDVEFRGTPHDALDDSLHELRIILAAAEHHRCSSSVLELTSSGSLATLTLEGVSEPVCPSTEGDSASNT